MKRFQVNASVQGKPVLLTVESTGTVSNSEFEYFKIRKGKRQLAIMRMDGECNLVSNTKNIFSEEDTQRLCKEIFLHLKKDDPELTVIYL